MNNIPQLPRLYLIWNMLPCAGCYLSKEALHDDKTLSGIRSKTLLGSKLFSPGIFVELTQGHSACVLWVMTIPTQWWTTNLSSHHCIGLPWSSLSVGKHTSIVTLKCWLEHNSSKIFVYLQCVNWITVMQVSWTDFQQNLLLRAHTESKQHIIFCLLQCTSHLFLWNKMTITGIHRPVGVVILKLFGVVSCLTNCYTTDSLK